jgi:adenylate cyclase class 2
MSMIEVEIKFRVPDRALIDRLVAHAGLEFGPAQLQRDLYFNHPQRCFRETDEALRIRSTGDENALTYKAPRLDTLTRTRPETEIPFASGAQTAEQLRSVLLALGFREIEQVEKRRRTAAFEWQGRPVEVTLDEVTDLGLYLEIEMLADESTWQTARDQIVAIAKEWEILELREPRSYLRMLLERPGGLLFDKTPVGVEPT